MFLKQAKDQVENIRVQNNNLSGINNVPISFTPAQFGGLFGQNTTLASKLVMEVTEYDGSGTGSQQAIRPVLPTKL